MITCRLYQEGILKEEGFDPAAVSDHLARDGCLVWLDIADPTPDDLELCRREFDLHEEAVKDVVERNQRTKVDQYGTFFVVVAYGVSGPLDDITEHEMHIFAGPNYLLTFRFTPLFDLGPVLGRWDRQPTLNVQGGGALLHVLLDELVDSFFPVIERFDEAADDIEDRVFAPDVEQGLHGDIYELKKSLVAFRRLVFPLREVMDFLSEDVGVVKEPLKPYFRDIYDNVYRVLEFVDSTRETMAAALSAYQSAVGNQMNLVMKKLSAWAAILLVPTLVAGIYGMNFEHMPELRQPWGYPAALSVMAGICSMLYLAFRRNDWL